MRTDTGSCRHCCAAALVWCAVSWMEDAELSDLTQETLLQQYKSIKRRTSVNFTYEQGSHVMQVRCPDHRQRGGRRLPGHAAQRVPAAHPFPSPDWLEFEQRWDLQQRRRAGGRNLLSTSSRRHWSSSSSSSSSHNSGHAAQAEQRDADLMPLKVAAQHSHCPKRRAAAAKALQQAEAARQSLDLAAAAAVANLIKHPAVGHVMLARLGWSAPEVLPQAHPVVLGALVPECAARRQREHPWQGAAGAAVGCWCCPG